MSASVLDDLNSLVLAGMPGQKAYGKRSRAIYDPFAAFISPQRKSFNNTEEVQVLEVIEELSRVKLANITVQSPTKSARKVLAERNANPVLQLVQPGEKKSKRRTGAGRRIVTDDSEVDEATDKQTPETQDIELCTSLHAIILLSEPDQQDDVHKKESGYHSDDVPMFCDGHGYESEWDEEDELRQEQQQRASVLDTPSISIRAATPPPLDEYSDHCRDLLALSSHSKSIFSEWSNQLSSHFSLTKIAEASFGEVYRLSLLEQLPGFSSNDESVFKVIALKPPDSTLPIDKKRREATLKRAEGMSSPEDVANEVRLLQRMSSIPGFTNFRDVRVVQGRPPQAFAKAFKAFNASQKSRKKETSHFPDPAKKASYADDQLWAVIEMQDAGTDLERCVEGGESTSIWFAWDVFWQVVLSLAKGEEGAAFEHRDLHLGNICVRQLQHRSSDYDTKRKLNFTGVDVTIIDYTISRALMSDGTVAYQDLAKDNSQFEGNSTEEYQYDIYRYMRGALLLDDPYADFAKVTEPPTERSWEQYHPITNLVWLHFILYKLLEQVEWPSAVKAPPRKQKIEHAQWKRANDLEHVLLRVQDLLDPGVVCRNEMKSASDLVCLALRECWFDVEDVVGLGKDDSVLTQQVNDLTLDEHSTKVKVVNEVSAPAKRPKMTRQKTI